MTFGRPVPIVLFLAIAFLASGRAFSAEFADLVVVNALVITIDPAQPNAGALAVRDGQFLFVGAESAARKLIGPKTVVVDAGGRELVPGFNDSHVHLFNIGSRLLSVDLRESGIEAIRERAAFIPEGTWITGSGWHESRMPSLADLDKAAPNNPVFVWGQNPLFAVANSAALRLSRIPQATLPLTGASLAQVRRHVPDSPSRLAVLEAASNYAAAFGVTSVQDVSSDDLSEELRELERNGSLKIRVYDCVGIDKPIPKIDRNPESAIRTGCIKHYVDGTEAEVYELSRRLALPDRGGVQLMLHATGSRAIRNALQIFENIGRANGKRDRRMRIEHATAIRTEDFPRFKRLGIIASMQPALFDDGSEFYSSTFGSLRSSGVALAFGSDAAMIPIDPFAAIASSTRNFGLTRTDAIAAHTAGSSFAEFQERAKGTISAGKVADFVILRDGKVIATFRGGVSVYRNAGF